MNSIYNEVANIYSQIFIGLREDVFSWLIPTLSIITIIVLILALLWLVFAVVRAFRPNKRQFIDLNEIDTQPRQQQNFKKKKNKLY